MNSSGVLIGFSTDGPGAIRTLQSESVAIENSSILVLGSGGVARAITFALRALTPQPCLQILGIDEPETRKLVLDLNTSTAGKTEKEVPAVSGVKLTDESLEKAMAEADIVIHATPIGSGPAFPPRPGGL